MMTTCRGCGSTVEGPPASPTGSDRLVLTVDEAAYLLNISRGLAYELVARGELPAIRLGRRIVIPRVAMEDLLGTPSLRARNDRIETAYSVEAGLMAASTGASSWSPSSRMLPNIAATGPSADSTAWAYTRSVMAGLA